MPRGQSDMCVVNAALVPHISRLAGPQTQVMRRIGISWNSWIKVAAGLPIRVSVGIRLRNRILSQAAYIPEIQALVSKLSGRNLTDLGIDGHFLLRAKADVATRTLSLKIRSIEQAQRYSRSRTASVAAFETAMY